MITLRASHYLKIILGAMVIFAICPGMAAPLCSAVLIQAASISTREVDAVIDNLARLKITTDVAKSQQSNRSISLKAAAQDFAIKKAELIKILKGTKSEAEIVKLISDRISDIQNKNEVVEAKESSEREAEHRVVPKDFSPLYAKKYEFKERIEIPFSPTAYSTFEYFPKLHSVLFEVRNENPKTGQTSYDLDLFDVTSREKKTVIENIRTTLISKKRDSVYAVDLAGDVVIYDIQANQKRILPLKSESLSFRRIHSMHIDPSGNQLLVVCNEMVYIVDLQTGKMQIDAVPGERIKDAKFLSDDELLVKPNLGSMYVLNLMNNLQTWVDHGDKPGNPYSKIFVTEDYRQVILNGGRNIVVVPTDKISDIPSNKVSIYDDLGDRSFDAASAVKFIKVLSPGNGVFAKFELKQSARYDILYADEAASILPLFSFDSYVTKFGKSIGSPWNLALDPVDGTAVMHVIESSKQYLDIWKADQ
jgi:hypothetical protein